MKTNKLSSVFLLASTLFVLCSFASCTKQLKGTISVSGTIIDEYTRQPIPNLYLVIGETSKGGMGQYSHHVTQLSNYYKTDANGKFSFSYESDEIIIATLSIMNINPIDSQKLSDGYDLKKFGDESIYLNEGNIFSSIRLKKNNTPDLNIEITKRGTFQMNLLKNNSIAVDTIKFNYLNFKIQIKSDSTFYVRSNSNYLNKYDISRSGNIIWQDSIYFDNKGDTIARNIQL